MKDSIFQKVTWIMIAVCLILFSSTLASAEETVVSYTANVILPDNQINKKVGYFDLLVNPGGEQVLEILVTNSGTEDLQVNFLVNTAWTNGSGALDYGDAGDKDPSLAVDVASMIAIDQPVITVPASDEAIAKFKLTIPEEPFEGIALGAITVGRVIPEGEYENMTEGGGIVIHNEFFFVLGVQLRESDAPVEPDFEMPGTRLGDVIGFPALILDIRNPKPLLTRGIALDVRVFPDGAEEATLELKRSALSMAPNSLMNYAILLDDADALPSGTYRIDVTLSFEEKTWELSAPLVIG